MPASPYDTILSRNRLHGRWHKPGNPKGGDVRDSGRTHRHSTVRRPLRRIRRSLPAFPPSRQAFPQERLTAIMDEARKEWRKGETENVRSAEISGFERHPLAILSTFSKGGPPCRRHYPHSTHRSVAHEAGNDGIFIGLSDNRRGRGVLRCRTSTEWVPDSRVSLRSAPASGMTY
jgi:hypothetical protein